MTNTNNILDFDSFPVTKKGIQVVNHTACNSSFKSHSLGLFLPTQQNIGNHMNGREMKEIVERENSKLPNVNILEYLLKNQKFIWGEYGKPSRGATRYVYFWGTIFKDRRGEFVYGLYWSNFRYFRCKKYIDKVWKWNHQSAIF